jgi:hypothetical protein
MHRELPPLSARSGCEQSQQGGRGNESNPTKSAFSVQAIKTGKGSSEMTVRQYA